MSTPNPNLNPHLKFRSIHATGRGKHPISTDELRQRLMTWMQWRRQGYKGDRLERRTKLTVKRAREIAAQLDIDLGGLA